MHTANDKRPTPEQLLEQLESEEEHQSTGRLKIFLGYTSGVGKSFRMLDEGRRRRDRGQDVVVGAMQPTITPDVYNTVSTLEIIPLKTMGGMTVMDMETIMARSPRVCLVDGLAYDNPPGSKHEKRWQDVDELLKAGISVITSVNLQHIQEKQERVSGITGKVVTETIPLAFLNKADEIVVVDAPPETCMITSGANGKATRKLTQHQLSELREVALLLAADVVDEQLERYLVRHGIQQSWGTQERILVVLSPKANYSTMIESGARNRDRFHGELITAHFNRPEWNKDQRANVEKGLDLAKKNESEIVELDGVDIADAVLDFARQRGITQIYVGHKGRDSWYERAFGSDLDKLIRAAEGIDVRVFPHA